MPTYIYTCVPCNVTYTEWRSIHDDSPPPTHPCGVEMLKVFTAPAIHGLNPAVARIDRTEKRWERDLPAYARLRRDGLQPPGIDGSGDLETRADDEWFVKTGGDFSVPADRTTEINEMLADGQVNDQGWDPVQQVKENREVAKKADA